MVLLHQFVTKLLLTLTKLRTSFVSYLSLNSVVTRYSPLWSRPSPHGFVYGNSHENFPMGHPSQECSRPNLLNFGVPMESETSEFPKDLVLYGGGHVHIRHINPLPVGRCGMLQSIPLRGPTSSSTHSHHKAEWL